MPINKLYVEGNLESEILNPILQGSPVLQQGGSKNGLKPRARTERNQNKVEAGYLRDRDFDFAPTTNVTIPTVDAEDQSVPFGWRWCRHEIENYLIEPALVSKAYGWSEEEIAEAIVESARRIRFYEAARWTIGITRRALPPAYELNTRPSELNEIDLPTQIDTATVNAWLTDSIRNHRDRIVAATDMHSVQNIFVSLMARFDDAFVANPTNVLLWFSGKDILAGMADWLRAKSVANAGLFRASLRDWIIANPSRALELLPEWDNLTRVLRA